METTYVFLSVLAVSLASFAGIATFALKLETLRGWLFVLIGLAAGTLIGDAVIHLIPESLETIGDERTFGFALLSGVLVFFILEKYLRWHHAHHVSEEEHAEEEAEHHPRHLAPLVILADGLHNFVDGAVIAASFLVSPVIGLATTVAVFIHELPQEIADYALLVHSGLSRIKALFFNFVSALTAFLGASAVLLAHSALESLGAYVVAFTAGAFIYIGATDLVPELHKTRDPRRSATELLAFVVGIALMFALTYLE